MSKLQENSPMFNLRKKLKLNQRDMARLVAKSQGFLSDLESGSVDLPNDVVAKLAELGVDGPAISKEHEAFMTVKLEEIKKRAIESLKNG